MASGQPDFDHNCGTVTIIGGRTHLRFERQLLHPVARVWHALTDPIELRAWLAEAEIDPVEGGRVVLRWLNTDEAGNRAVAQGKLSRCVPSQTIEFDTDLHGRLRFELTPTAEGCKLVFTTEGLVPKDFLLRTLAGWHVHLDFLADALEGQKVDWPHWPFDRWQTIYDQYEAQTAVP